MDIQNMKQLRNAHRASMAHKELSLKAFARLQGVLDVVTVAHQNASKGRSDAKRARTSAASIAKKAGGKK